jgi:type IV fimbrial biogenesis protein FimT
LLDSEGWTNVLNSIKKSAEGFTLIEIMVAVAIMGILLSVAAPNFRAWILNSQIHAAAESVQTGLQRARAEAVKRNRTVEFVLLGGNSWAVLNPTDLSKLEQNSESAQLKTVLSTPAPVNATRVAFGVTGLPLAISPTDGSPMITQIDFDSTVLNAAESKELRVTIDFSGRIRMCDPNSLPPSPKAC